MRLMVDFFVLSKNVAEGGGHVGLAGGEGGQRAGHRLEPESGDRVTQCRDFRFERRNALASGRHVFLRRGSVGPRRATK